MSLVGEGRYGNTAVYFDHNGRNLGTYSKVHLFGPWTKTRYLAGGDSLAAVETEWGKAGLAICYDLRFPELFRAYALAGSRLLSWSPSGHDRAWHTGARCCAPGD